MNDQNTATALITLQLAAGAAFWATVAWGILDAQLLFKREVVVDTRERSGAPAASPPKKSKRSSISIIPTLGGVGVVGTF